MHRPGLLAKLVFIVSLAALMVLPSIASAVLSGANGRIVYVSGRGYGDAQAKLYLRTASGSLGFGTNTGPLSMASGQHRHPTWSPDRTQIAYSLGGDIIILDLTNRFAIPQKLTNTAGIEDRPAWSPDGTRIAYEAQVAAQQDIIVKTIADGTTVNLTNASAQVEGKPAWTPDSTTIFYAFNNNADIYKEPADNSQANGTAVLNSGVGEFQPSISPDGTQMCYTRGAFNGTADVYVTSALGTPGAGTNLTADNVGTEPIHGDYNCTWSPDGTAIAYARGTFTNGDLYMEKSDNSEFTPILGPLEGAENAFDGNPDWAPDGRPVCEDLSVTTTVNKPVVIGLECFDSGPFYERSFVRESRSQPDNGTVSDVEQGDQGPSTLIYTPNQGFSGTDQFAYNSFDEIAGFGEPKTVTVKVEAPPPAQAAPDPAPVLSNLTVKPRKWRRGNKLAKISAPLGAKVRWRLSEAASTRLTFQKLRRRGGKARFVNVVSRTIGNARAGQNIFSFQGRVTPRRKLGLGVYRVSAQARDAAGQASKRVNSGRFRIVAR